VTQYERALEQARIRDAAKQAKDGKGTLPVRVAVTDPDSMIVPNKEGGFAPNYTPTVAVDVATRMIVLADVLNGSDESTAVLPAIAQAQREHLARRGGKLGRAAFVYDAQNDQYHCPMGVALLPVRKEKSGTRYPCPGKAGCPMGDQCAKDTSAARSVVRDPYQDQRETVGRRMATPEGRAVYRKRAPVVEGAFARLKQGMGIRRFLMRGLAKVRTEWNWICASYNLKRLMVIQVNAGPGKPGKPAIESPGTGPMGQQGCLRRFRYIRDVLNCPIRRSAWLRATVMPTALHAA